MVTSLPLRALAAALLLVSAPSVIQAAPLSVSSARALPRAGTKLVDVYYDVSGGAAPYSVTLQGSLDGGTTWTLPIATVSGDVGNGVAAGSNRKVTWDAGADWAGQISNNVRFRVSVTDAAIPPAPSVPVGSSSILWRRMLGNYDYHSDQQTGQADGDIVGDIGTNYGFLAAFNKNGDVSSIDGTLAFRVRLDAAGGTNNNPKYSNLVWVGLDANTDGKIDVFLGANFQGGGAGTLEIRGPGTGLNISPSTTTISNAVYKTYTLDTIEDSTPANYSYRAVDFSSDGGTTNDVTANTSGDPDYYLSFMIPFADIVAFLGSLQTPIVIDDTEPLRFIVATSSQPTSINQDIGGLPKNFDDADTWENLGGFTPPFNPVPEP